MMIYEHPPAFRQAVSMRFESLHEAASAITADIARFADSRDIGR